jgi:hypothetical protein
MVLEVFGTKKLANYFVTKAMKLFKPKNKPYDQTTTRSSQVIACITLVLMH